MIPIHRFVVVVMGRPTAARVPPRAIMTIASAPVFSGRIALEPRDGFVAPISAHATSASRRPRGCAHFDAFERGPALALRVVGGNVMKITSSLALTAFALGLVCTQACSSAPAGSAIGDGSAAESGKGNGKDGAQTPPSSPSGSTSATPPAPPSSSGSSGSPTDDASCAAKGDQCQTCCETNHPKGSETYWNAFNACMCGAKGACQTECAASDCSADDNAPASKTGDACDVCETKALDTGGACDTQIAAACTDADCTAFSSCNDACP
jgi:hypothetical protein